VSQTEGSLRASNIRILLLKITGAVIAARIQSWLLLRYGFQTAGAGVACPGCHTPGAGAPGAGGAPGCCGGGG
jgi:hypothetical protein